MPNFERCRTKLRRAILITLVQLLEPMTMGANGNAVFVDEFSPNAEIFTYLYTNCWIILQLASVTERIKINNRQQLLSSLLSTRLFLRPTLWPSVSRKDFQWPVVSKRLRQPLSHCCQLLCFAVNKILYININTCHTYCNLNKS